MNYDETRAAVRAAFSKLRKQNIITKMNFMCCMGCACSVIEPLLEEKGKFGAVYFHKQDNDSFVDYGYLYIRFISREEGKGKEVGDMLSAALKDAGLTVDWDGESGTAIRIDVDTIRI